MVALSNILIQTSFLDQKIYFENWKSQIFDKSASSCLTRYQKILWRGSLWCKKILKSTCLTASNSTTVTTLLSVSPSNVCRLTYRAMPKTTFKATQKLSFFVLYKICLKCSAYSTPPTLSLPNAWWNDHRLCRLTFIIFLSPFFSFAVGKFCDLWTWDAIRWMQH